MINDGLVRDILRHSYKFDNMTDFKRELGNIYAYVRQAAYDPTARGIDWYKQFIIKLDSADSTMVEELNTFLSSYERTEGVCVLNLPFHVRSYINAYPLHEQEEGLYWNPVGMSLAKGRVSTRLKALVINMRLQSSPHFNDLAEAETAHVYKYYKTWVDQHAAKYEPKTEGGIICN